MRTKRSASVRRELDLEVLWQAGVEVFRHAAKVVRLMEQRLQNVRISPIDRVVER
jgi:hypothetical protein